MIAHADRLWGSATQNAARLAQRIQLVGGGLLALIGVGFSAFGWMDKVVERPEGPAWLVTISDTATFMAHGAFLVAEFYLLRALARLYVRDSASKGMAADGMEFDAADLGEPIKTVIFKKTYRAYLSLKERNVAEKKRLRQAQEWFSVGLALMVATAIVYVAVGGGMKALSQRGDHDDGITRTPVAKPQR
jgi:hypothetical protein